LAFDLAEVEAIGAPVFEDLALKRAGLDDPEADLAFDLVEPPAFLARSGFGRIFGGQGSLRRLEALLPISVNLDLVVIDKSFFDV